MSEKISNCVPIRLPPLTVGFQKALNEEEKNLLIALGAGIIPSKKDEDLAYTFGGHAVTEDLLNKIYRHAKKAKMTNMHPFASTNLAGYQGLFKAMGIITWFLKTHTYPAFSGPIDENEEGGGAFDIIEGLVSGKRKGVFGDRAGAKKGKGDEEVEDDVEMDDVEEDVSGLEDLRFGTGEESIPKAKPSTTPDIIFGTYNDMPTLPGLVFPFFDDMLETDTNFVASVVRTYFLECLGDTRDGILAGYRAFKGSMGSVAPTLTGKVLQHIFGGIKLAIESQARLFLLYDQKRYLGFTIHGWYFTISIDGYKHRPLVHKELLGKVRLIDEHAVAVAEILAKLMKMKLDTGKKPTKKYLQDAKVDVVSNPRKLADLIREFDLSDQDDVVEIEKLANRLSFPQRYLEFSVENVLRAVDLLVAGSFPPVDLPMYVRGGTLTTLNPVLSVFAMFGNEAFSFRTAGGKPTRIPKDNAEDTLFKPYRGKAGKEVRPNPSLIISKKSLGLCCEDWIAFLADKSFLVKITRDSAFRCVVFGGPKAKSLWDGLIQRIGPLSAPTDVNLQADAIDLGDDVIDEPADDFEDFL